MSDLIELLLSVIIDGAVDAAGSKRVHPAVRFVLAAALLLLFLGVVVLLAWAGEETGNAALLALAVLIFAGGLIPIILKYRDRRKRDRDTSRSVNTHDHP